MSKKDRLLDWCNTMRLFSRVDIEHWALNNYYVSADRRVREFVNKGLIRRLSEAEIVLRGFRKKGLARVAWYRVI